MSATWVVPEITADFTSDFEDLVIPYIITKYALADPLKTDTTHFQIHVGFYDFGQPYEIAALQTDTRIEQWLNSRAYVASTGVEIFIRMERLTDNKVDPQLGNMEREIIRIAGQYRPNDITGIKLLRYDGGERVYNGTDDYSKTDWRCVVRLRALYEKRDAS
jgi:hypothetical protein